MWGYVPHRVTVSETSAHFIRSMVTFLIAFLSMCIHKSSAWELVFVGAVSALVVAAIIWCIVMMAWEPHSQPVEADIQTKDVREEQGESLDEGDGKTDFRRSWKVSWRWPRFLFRKTDTITVVNV